MSLTIGIDLGLAMVKGVAMSDGKLMAQALEPAGAQPAKIAQGCYQQLLDRSGATAGDVDGCMATGWAAKRVALEFEPTLGSEIGCLARGARWACGSAATAVDIGAQIVKAVQISPKGRPKRYELSDKCASGSGRFLEIMASALELDVQSLAEVGAAACDKVVISAQCSVFAESEIVSLANTGAQVSNIVNGVNYSIAQRVATIAMRVEAQEDLVICGGVAKNTEVVRYLSEILSIKPVAYDIDPQLICAVGAALEVA